jgi:hypothetical protein
MSNIQCSEDGCDNPVIGQCKVCGRFYCREHAGDEAKCLSCESNERTRSQERRASRTMTKLVIQCVFLG